MRTTISQAVYRCARARPRKKEPHRPMYDEGNATCYAKQQHSTIPEGRYPSQPVAAQTGAARASVRRALESDF